MTFNEGKPKEASAAGLFPKLPHPVLIIVLQHLDAASLSRLEQSSRWFASLLKQPGVFKDDDYNQENGSDGNEKKDEWLNQNKKDPSSNGDGEDDEFASNLSQLVWKPLFYQRFKMHSREALETQRRQPHRYKAHYIRRHLVEASAYRGLIRLDEETNQTRLLFVVSHFITMGNNVMDLCWRIWTTQQQQQQQQHAHDRQNGDMENVEDFPKSFWERRSKTNTPAIRRMYAQSFLRLLHCASVAQDFMVYLQRRGQGRDAQSQEVQEPSGTIQQPQQQQQQQQQQPLDDCRDLEELMILVSKTFYKLSPQTMEDTTSIWIRTTLDDLANQVQKRLALHHGGGGSREAGEGSGHPRDIVEALHYVLFDDAGSTNGRGPFVGNSHDYYNYQNSLLHTMLETRMGLPLTLAILYQCLGRRLGLLVDIIGLPGHIVIYLPALNQYVDVFARGRFLTLQDCHDIVTHYAGLVMDPSFLQPLAPEMVLRRVLNNLENAFARRPSIRRDNNTNNNNSNSNSNSNQRHHGSCSPRRRQRVMVTVLKALLSRPDTMQLEECRNLMSFSWVAEHVEHRGDAWVAW